MATLTTRTTKPKLKFVITLSHKEAASLLQLLEFGVEDETLEKLNLQDLKRHLDDNVFASGIHFDNVAYIEE